MYCLKNGRFWRKYASWNEVHAADVCLLWQEEEANAQVLTGEAANVVYRNARIQFPGKCYCWVIYDVFQIASSAGWSCSHYLATWFVLLYSAALNSLRQC